MMTKDLENAHLAEAQRVLIVDDEPSILSLLQRFFQRLGYDCRTFSDAEAALEELGRHRYDLVITDMVMPFGLSGLQLVEEIVRRHPRTPVIVMTGFPIIEAVTRCLKAGAADYVQKPFDFARLKSIVQAVLVERAIESDALLRNRLISGYRIVRPYQEDPYAPTFLAQAVDNPDASCILKIFRFYAQNPRQQRRIQEDFCRSAEMAARIDNPYVLKISDHGVEPEGAIPYLVSEHFDAFPLKVWNRAQLPNLKALVAVFRDIARGLAGIHAVGLIQTDLTPETVMVSMKSEVKLIPFTAARIRHFDTTVHDVIHGSPPYLAPEIFLGHTPTPRTDLFSFGVMLYELIAGQKPFNAPSLNHYARAICEAPHRPIQELAPAVPTALAETLDVLLAKDPADRYPNAASAAAALASAFRVDAAGDSQSQPAPGA